MGAALFVTTAAILLAGITQPAAQQGNEGESEIQRGFSIAPVPLDLEGKRRGLVGLGSYYVNGVSDCIGCHTAEGGEYLGGGAPFGPVLSRNLTPDADGLPAGLTLDQFTDVMREGTDYKALPPDAGGRLIVMPWMAYRHGTDRWTEAIYEYLRAVPCVEGGPGTLPNRCN
jgi:mono/diheme cytochrome c family protein